MVERFNRSLLQLLRAYVVTKDDWETYLPLVLFAYRTSKHTSTGYPPYLLMYGRQPQYPILPLSQTCFEPSSYVLHLQTKLADLKTFVDEHLATAAQAQKEYYDRQSSTPQFKPGDPVWLTDPTAKKLDPRWEGGWKVTHVMSPVTVEISKEERTKVVHVNRLQHRLQPYPLEGTTTSILDSLGLSETDHEIVQGNLTQPPPVVHGADQNNEAPRYPQRERRPPDRLTY